MEWVDANLGSKLTMKYPAVWLMEDGAHGEVLSIAFAGEGQLLDAGAKMVHVAPHTTSTIVSKSISKGGGRTSYRGLVRVEPGAEQARLLRAVRRPHPRRGFTLRHLSLHGDRGERHPDRPRGDRLQGRRGPALLPDESGGLTEEEATSMIVAGFIEPIVRKLPWSTPSR